MKTIIFVIYTLAMSFANAAILEVNKEEKKIYMVPTPIMEITIQNLGSDGGIVYLNLTYNGKKSVDEVHDIESRYPGFEVQSLVSNKNGYVIFEMKDIVYQEFEAREQQLGPQINTQFRLTSEQMKKISVLQESDINQMIKVTVPARVEYRSLQVVEEYKSDVNVCESVKSATVKEVVMNLSNIQRPKSIAYEETFRNFQSNLLAKCFEIESKQVQSFTELLNLNVHLNHNIVVGGSYSMKKMNSKSIVISPILQIDVL